MEEKEILVIGSKLFTVIGVAAGTDVLESTSLECGELLSRVRENISRYAAIIIDDATFTKCQDLRRYLVKEDILVVVAPTPDQLGRIDIRRYYEKLIGETIGMKISLE